MIRWIDQPVWGDSTGLAVLKAVSNALVHEAEMREAWGRAAMEPGKFPFGDTPRNVWNAMLRDAYNAGRLEQLLGQAEHLQPALTSSLAVAFAEVAPLRWYSCTDPYSSRMLGPGARRALINRSQLRKNLRDIVLDDYLVCNIQGQSGTGKSHSGYLIQHLAQHPQIGSESIRIDIKEDHPNGVDAHAFVTGLAERLGMSSTFVVDEATHATSIADSLARKFLSRFPDLRARARWIFIDGLDRPGVQDDVHVFVRRLALAAANGELKGVRLFMTGYRGDFHNDVLDVLCQEEIDSIDRSHLEDFFTDIAEHVGAELEAEEAVRLADRVLERASLSDLGRLGLAASEVAREHFKRQ